MGVFALLCPMSTHKICRAYHVQDHARTSDRMSSGCAQHPPTRISVRPRSKSSHITALQECSRKLRQNRNEKGQERDNSLLAACAVDMHMDIIKITIQGKKIPVKCRRPRPRQPFSASLRNRNAHGQVTRTSECENVQGKMSQTKTGTTVCASLRSRNECGYRIFMSNTANQDQTKSAAQILCVPAQWKCTWTCHKNHFTWKFTRKTSARGPKQCGAEGSKYKYLHV